MYYVYDREDTYDVAAIVSDMMLLIAIKMIILLEYMSELPQFEEYIKCL